MDENNTSFSKKTSRIFKCQTCPEIFTTQWDFKCHLTVHPKGNILICKYCQKEFKKQSEMKIHERSHTGSRPFQCEICGMSFMIKNILRKHELTHQKERSKEFECEICKKTFSRKQYLQEHMRTHTGSKPYKCEICHKSFVGKTGLNHHKKTHNSEDEKRSVVCEVCGKSFTRHALWTHMKYHSKEHKCEFCIKSFATIAALKIHVAGAHLGHSWHNCDTCGKGFNRKGHLIRHLKIHEDEKNLVFYSCEDCSSKFKDESHLKAHIKRKHKELSQSFSCSICSKQFSTKSSLKYHRLLHFHERPHKCNICNKSFAIPYQLRDHVKLHHYEEKQFQCPVCEKKCATHSLLRKHLLTHRPTITPKKKTAGEFLCSYCDKNFSSKLALSNHLRSHNFSRPYQCIVCRKAFRYQDSLLKHLQLHPNDAKNEETKELPRIYTIKVCKPSFTSLSSNTLYHEKYTHDLPANTLLEPESLIDLNLPEKSFNSSVKPIEDFINLPSTEVQDVDFIQQPVGSNEEYNASFEKTSIITSVSEKSFSIIIDESLCYNSSIPTDSSTSSSMIFFPQKLELPSSVVNVELPVSSGLLPIESSSTLIVDH